MHSQYIENIAFFIKFGKEEHINSLYEGNIYTNNIDYYIKLEDISGEVGVGDRTELSTKISNIENMTFTNNETGERIFLPNILGNLEIHPTEEEKKMPVFCITAIRKDELLEDEEGAYFSFNKIDIDKLKKDFKDYTHAILIDPTYFVEKISLASEKEKKCVDMNMINYYDPGINQENRINEITTHKKAFWKDNRFKSQKEFRIIFYEESIDNGLNLLNIDSLQDVSMIINKDEILDDQFKLRFNRK